jgi:RNA polymerase sigma-70 factor (ECF subfamily)
MTATTVDFLTREPAAAPRETRKRAWTARPSRDQQDLQDVKALVTGDSKAWGRFVRSNARVVYAAVQRRLVSAGRDEVDDVAQDVFLRLCKSDYKLLRGFDPARARLTTWLTVIATSAAIDHLRKRRHATVAIDDVSEAHMAVEDPVFERIRIPPGLLSPRQTLVLELLYRKDLEVSDAARIMNVDPQTVRSTHHKALTKLRAHFQAEELV